MRHSFLSGLSRARRAIHSSTQCWRPLTPRADATQNSRSAAAEVRKLNPFFDVARFGSLFKKTEHRDKLAAALKKTGL